MVSHDLLGSTNVNSSCVIDLLTSNSELQHNSSTISVNNGKRSIYFSATDLLKKKLWIGNSNTLSKIEKKDLDEVAKNNLFEELNNLGKDLLAKSQKPNKVEKCVYN